MRTALFLVCGLCSVWSSDWSQWRGPGRDGSAPHFKAPDTWPDHPQRVWKQEVGSGYGSPVVSDERVYLLVGEGNREYVRCLDLATGEQVWEYGYDIVFKANQYAVKFGKGPFATPLVAGNHVITVGITGVVCNLDKNNGALIWRRDFTGPLDDDRLLFCGNSTSPLLVDDLCVTHVGNEPTGHMTAYSLKEGKQRWRWDGDLPGYASPILADIADKRQIITMTQNNCVGIDPLTGKELWRYPYQVEWRENIVSPIVYKDLAIISGREHKATTALRITKTNGGWQVAAAWTNKELVMYIGSPVLHSDRLFGLSHLRKGSFFCLDAATGQTLWQSEGRLGQSAMPIVAGDHILLMGNDGQLYLLDTGADRWQPLKTWELADSPVWAYPAVLDDSILVKDARRLTRWRF